MRNLLYILLLAVTIAIAGCASKGADDAACSNSEYTEAAAMSIHLTEPERALSIIDSAVIVGNLSWPRAEYLKAVTQYGGFDNMPLALQTCLDLIECEEALTDTLTIEQTVRCSCPQRANAASARLSTMWATWAATGRPRTGITPPLTTYGSIVTSLASSTPSRSITAIGAWGTRSALCRMPSKNYKF